MATPDAQNLPLEVSCQLVSGIFDLCEELSIDRREVCAGLPYDYEHLSNPKQWIDWRTLDQLSRRFEALSGRSSESLGEASAMLLDRGAYRSVFAIASLVISPVSHCRWFFATDGQFHRLYRVLETSFTEHPDGDGCEWTIQLRPPDYPLTPGFFWTIKAQSQAVFRRLGALDTLVEFHSIERGYRYVARFKKRSLALRTRERLSWPVRLFRAHRMLKDSNAQLLDRLAALEAEVRGRERAEEQLRLQMAKSETLQDQIARGERLHSLGLVAGGVAHDFNNLLTGIMGYVELASEDPISPEDLRQYLEGIHEAAERASELTRQLLAFGRQQATKTQRTTLAEVVSRAIQMLRRLLPPSIELSLELPNEADDDAPLELLLDPGQVEQVVMNLALNARDAMAERGRLELRVGAETLDAHALASFAHKPRPGRFATLEVRDTGEGIRADDLARIFDPFFTTKEEGEGTGLGLSVVFGVVQRHGGVIQVESERGVGTCFRVSLPEATAAELELARARTARGPAPRGDAAVLVVDDDPLVRTVAERLLRGAGYRVELACDGEQAVVCLEQRRAEFDLLFTDLVMPRRSGLSLVREAQRRWPRLPVLVSTGYARHPEAIDELREAGIPLLRKPYVREEILWAVHDALAP